MFGLGAALAGLAGLMQAPILTVQIGMGENILILAFVITVIGGIGSIRGAFVAAILGRLYRYARARLFHRSAALAVHQGSGGDGCARSVLHADLSADGDRPGDPAGRPVSGEQQMTWTLNLRAVVVILLLLALVLLPVYVELAGNRFLLTLFTRIVILALAAVEPQPDPRLWRDDEFRSRRLSRHRRLFRRNSRLRRRHKRFRSMAGSAPGLVRCSRW